MASDRERRRSGGGGGGSSSRPGSGAPGKRTLTQQLTAPDTTGAVAADAETRPATSSPLADRPTATADRAAVIAAEPGFGDGHPMLVADDAGAPDAGPASMNAQVAGPSSPGREPTLREIVQRRCTAPASEPPALEPQRPRRTRLNLGQPVVVQPQAADGGGGDLARDDIHAVAEAGATTPTSALPYRDDLESSFGRDLSFVRAHVGGDAERSATAAGAEAFARGDDVVLPSSPSKHIVAHEVAHVLQQRAGGVEVEGGVGQVGDRYENEADAVAERVVRGEPVAAFGGAGSVPSASAPVQRKVKGEKGAHREPNAQVAARALNAEGHLLAHWSGDAFCDHALPSQLTGHRQGKVWTWHWNDAAGPVAEPRVGDRPGQPASAWAPDEAASIAVDYRRLDAPFGTPLEDAGDLLGARSFMMEPAAGAEPLVTGGDIAGPLPPNSQAQSGDLTVSQAPDGVAFDLGSSRVVLTGDPDVPEQRYRYRVAPQANPRQRVVHVIAGWDVTVQRTIDDKAAVELVVQITHVQPDDPRLGPAPVPGSGLVIKAPDIVASGDENHVMLALDRSRLHIGAASPDARFAYYIDPGWSGPEHRERIVHVVATPGVRINEVDAAALTLGGMGSRRLVGNLIYVQSPAQVPVQGTPFEPSQFLGAQRFDRGTDPRAGISLYTGAAGITLRDQRLGATVSIRVADADKGGRFAYELDFAAGPLPELRVLTSPGVEVEVREPIRHMPTDFQDPYRDIGNANVVVYEAARSDLVPPQGDPLPFTLLAALGLPRKPHRVEEPAKSASQVAGELGADVAVGLMPGIGDVADLAEFGYAVSNGTDKWGNPLSRAELAVMGIAVLLPFVAVGMVKALGRGASAARRVSPLQSLAGRFSRSPEELEAIAAHLGKLDPASEAAVRRVEAALLRGEMFDPGDFDRVRGAIRAIGMGDLPVDGGAMGLRGVPAGGRIEVPGWKDGEPQPRASGLEAERATAALRPSAASITHLISTDLETANRILGRRTFARLDAAEDVLRKISAGDFDVISRELGVAVPKGFNTNDGLEFGLGQVDGGAYVIVRGESQAVDWSQLPAVRAVGHTHPSTRGNNLSPNAAGERQVSLEALRTPTETQHLQRALIFPSPIDVQFMSFHGIAEHRVFTPYVVNDGFVSKPTTDWVGKERLEFVVRGSIEVGHVAPSGTKVHRGTIVGVYEQKEVLRVEVHVTDPTIDTPDGQMFLTQPAGFVARPESPAAVPRMVAGSELDSSDVKISRLRAELSEPAKAELERIAAGKDAGAVWNILTKGGDPRRLLEGRAKTVAEAAAHAVAVEARVASTVQRLQTTGFFTSPSVQAAIRGQRESALIGEVAEHLAKLEFDDEFKDLVGCLVFEKVSVSRRFGGYLDIREAEASLPAGTKKALYQLDGSVWERVTDLDVLVIRDREVIRIGEVKAGGSPAAAKAQQAKGLAALAEIADGDAGVRLHYHGRDITDQVDAASAVSSKAKTVGPDNKQFEMKLGITSSDLLRVVREVVTLAEKDPV